MKRREHHAPGDGYVKVPLFANENINQPHCRFESYEAAMFAFCDPLLELEKNKRWQGHLLMLDEREAHAKRVALARVWAKRI